MLITDKQALGRFDASHRVWQGVPGIERTKNGRMFVTFYSGSIAETYGNFVLLYRYDDEAAPGELIAAVEKPGMYRCFDPGLWMDPLGRLWLFWSVLPGEEVWASICENPDADRLSWGEEFYIGRGVMMNKPTVLSNGQWLFPIALWPRNICEKLRSPGFRPEDEPRSDVYVTSDMGQSFVRLGGSAIANRDCDEHMVLELENGVLAMYVRTRYGIGVSYSSDGGVSWSAGEDTGWGGPCSRFHIRRLRSGRVLLINHVDFTERNNLTALLSEDWGRTFPHRLLLDERPQVSYPDVTEGEDGALYVVYDRQRGCNRKSLEEAYGQAREILVAKITEQDILCGQLQQKDSYLKRVVSKLDRLSADVGNPYEKKVCDHQ